MTFILLCFINDQSCSVVLYLLAASSKTIWKGWSAIGLIFAPEKVRAMIGYTEEEIDLHYYYESWANAQTGVYLTWG